MDSTVTIAVNVRRWLLQQFIYVVTLATLVLSLCMSFSRADDVSTQEYKIKARFIYNFARFVEWPTSAFPSPNSPFVIGILGEDPFGKLLDQTVQDKSISGHNIEVRRFSHIEDIQRCQILFIGGSETGQLATILGRLKGKSILTVGESPAFLDEGGVINLSVEQMSVRFQIDTDAAKSAQLSISSKLLGVASSVRRGRLNGGQ
jgi:hypothetical protein